MVKEEWDAYPEVFYATEKAMDEENEARRENTRYGKNKRPLWRRVTVQDLTIKE